MVPYDATLHVLHEYVAMGHAILVPAQAWRFIFGLHVYPGAIGDTFLDSRDSRKV